MRIIAPNRAEDASSISASPALLATKDEGNLILPIERGRTARTTSTAAQTITVDFAADIKAMAVAFARHNWTDDSTLRSRLYDSGASILKDTTALPGFVTSGLDTDVDDYLADYFRGKKNTVQYFDLVSTARQSVHDWADAANPDGYMEATKLFIGKYFEVTYNPTSVELTEGSASTFGRADDGTPHFDKRYRSRTIVVTLEAIPNATDLITLEAIADILGEGGECFIDLYPHDTGSMGIRGRGSFRLMSSPWTHQQYGHHKGTMRFEES